MAKLAPTPIIRTKTITVAKLLGKIKQIILAEPKRVNMEAFISALNGEALWSQGARRKQPACGTIGCIAGWGAILLRPKNVTANRLDLLASSVMSNLIGWDYKPAYSNTPGRTTGSLFHGGPLDGEDLGEPGTGKHAKAVAKLIDRYLEAHPEIADRKIDVAEARKMLS